jgi:hypothetical protein
VAKNAVAAALLSTKLYCPCRRRAGFATAITLNVLPSNRAWSVAAVLPMPIICDLRNQGRLAARSAMSSRSPCVAAIIEKSTAVAMKRHGGKGRALIQLIPLVFCGCRVIHY